MSEWGYLAKIIKEAKKAGKAAGKRKAIYKQNPKLAEANKNIVDDMSGYNQQLRNFLDGINNEGSYSDYTQKAANELFNTLDSQPHYNTEDYRKVLQYLQQSADINDYTGFNNMDYIQYLKDSRASNYNPYKELDYITNRIKEGSW